MFAVPEQHSSLPDRSSCECCLRAHAGQALRRCLRHADGGSEETLRNDSGICRSVANRSVITTVPHRLLLKLSIHTGAGACVRL